MHNSLYQTRLGRCNIRKFTHERKSFFFILYRRTAVETPRVFYLLLGLLLEFSLELLIQLWLDHLLWSFASIFCLIFCFDLMLRPLASIFCLQLLLRLGPSSSSQPKFQAQAPSSSFKLELQAKFLAKFQAQDWSSRHPSQQSAVLALCTCGQCGCRDPKLCGIIKIAQPRNCRYIVLLQ